MTLWLPSTECAKTSMTMWFADISREGLQRFPLPLGYPEHNPVELHAPQAYFDAPLQYAAGSGAANDWLMGWTDCA